MRKLFGRLWLFIAGWSPGPPPPPNLDKYVLIAAPHTSQWDFIFLIAHAWRFEVNIFWMGKHTLFRWPYRFFFTMLGGIPINRHKRTNVVEQIAERFRTSEKLIVTVPAEGTRSYRDYWKSGFYHIARAANVPIVLSFLDYTHKVGGFGPAIPPTGAGEVMDAIREFYRGVEGKFPKKFSRIRLKEED